MTLICCHQVQVLAVSELGDDGEPMGIVGERPESAEERRQMIHNAEPVPLDVHTRYRAGRGSW
eukprot:15248095-Alexandrium_andersonii.AAC.1